MAKTQNSTPSFFNFLKEGFLLPARNGRLLVAVFALMVASTTSFLFLGKILAVQPLTSMLNLDNKQPALNGTADPRSPDLQGVQDDTWNLMSWLISAGYHLFSVVGGAISRVVVLFAAVTTYSGELRTFAELLGKAKRKLKGPLLTRALLYALEIAYAALMGAMVGLLAVLLFALLSFVPFQNRLYVEVLVLFIPSFFFHNCFSFLCSLSVVVAVAEPGCYGAGAVARAWRLMKGEKRRVLLFVAVTVALAAVVSPVHTLAIKTSNAASGLLLEFFTVILLAAVEVFSVCATTAFYYECINQGVYSGPNYSA